MILETKRNQLIDNGASNSFISLDVLPAVTQKTIREFMMGKVKASWLKMIKTKMNTFNTNEEITGVVAELDLRMGAWKGSQVFIITDKMKIDVCLLGRDFLKTKEVVIDNRDDSITIHAKSIEVLEEQETQNVEENQSRNECVVRKTIVVPPRSEIRTCVTMNRVELDKIVLFEPTIKSDVLIAKSISQVKSDEIEINILNWNDKEVKIEAGEVIGKIAEMEEISGPKNAAEEKVGSSLITDDEIWKQISKLNFGENLNKENMETLQNLLFQHKKALCWSEWDLGRTKVIKHNIKTNRSRPVRQPTSRIPMALRPIVEKKVREMEENGIIKPSMSPWSSRIVMVKKKDGDWRFCVDFRDLNRVTEKEVYPLTRIDEAIDTLNGSRYFTCIDIKNGYWQVEIEEQDRHKTAFTTTNG